MNLSEAIKARRSVRNFTDKKIEGEVERELRLIIDECNSESGLRIQLCLNEPKAFNSLMARFGKFKNVKNYIALVGRETDDLQEKCGYYGEKVVLKAMQLGLCTCWVAVTYSKRKCAAKTKEGEKLLLVIAIGYGQTSKIPHKVKPIEQLCRVDRQMPDWFLKGMEAVQLAPTALNQQKFLFELNGNFVKATALPGSYVNIDLGIVKYHFEIGADKSDWKWAKW